MADSDWTYHANCLVPEGRELPPGITRFAAAVAYRGGRFSGWQRQKHSTSVQAEVETALSFVAGEAVTVACAGRTDAGVHATGQVIHFDTGAAREPANWVRGANSRLPPEIRLHWAGAVAPAFHARFSALSRTYRYVICNQPVAPAILAGLVTWYRDELDAPAMHRAAQALLGENDFSSYRAAGCQSRTPFRNVTAVSVSRRGRLVVVEISANAFLHHMVRNVVGALVAVGRGEAWEAWPGELLALRDRTLGQATAPAGGLYLVGVDYPHEFPLPPPGMGPEFVDPL